VRRVAVAALSTAWGPRANPWIGPLVEDRDDGVRLEALAVLRRHGGVDGEVVGRIARVLAGAVPAGSDARAGAALALADATGPARAAAAEVLAQALGTSGSASGFFQRMMAADPHRDDGLVLALARALLAIGGAEGIRIVQARASKASGDLKRQLLGLLDARR
jgi:hypothetical protein